MPLFFALSNALIFKCTVHYFGLDIFGCLLAVLNILNTPTTCYVTAEHTQLEIIWGTF